MICSTVLGSFFLSSAITLVAGGVTTIDINRQPANLSEAGEIICALKDKLSACEQLLRENRWPLLVRGEIDRIFDRYGSGVSLTKEEVDKMRKGNEDSRVRKMTKILICERMMNQTHYKEISSLKERIEEAHRTDNEITIKSFCEVLGDTYDCISENGAPYLRLSPGERMPKVVNMLTVDKVNKYLNILMMNAKVRPIKECMPAGDTSANSTVATDQTQSNATTATTSPTSEATTAAVEKKSADSATTTASTAEKSAGTTATVGEKSTDSAATKATAGEKSADSAATTVSAGKTSKGKKTSGTTVAKVSTAKNGTKV